MLPVAVLCALSGLECRVVPSVELAFEERFSHSMPGREPEPSGAGVVARKQSFLAFTLVRGWATDEQGEARLEADVRVTRPDGTKWYERKGAPIFRGAPAEGALALLSHDNLRLRFELGDPFGEYAIAVTVRDLVAGTAAGASGSVRLAPFPSDVRFEAKEDALDWMQTYCRQPRPNDAVEAFLCCARNGLLAGGATATRAWAFFGEVYSKNLHLFPPLLSKHAQAEGAVQEQVLRLVARAAAGAPEVLDKLAPAEREKCSRFAAEPRPDPYAQPVVDAAQLDTLWGIFLATGSYAPIASICRALGDPEDEPPSAAASRESVKRTARWLLATDAPSRSLVRGYLPWVRENEELPEPAPGVIDELLEDR